MFETRSAWSGRIRVIEDRRERRLVVAGDTLSVFPLDGDWAPVRREYWWRAVATAPLPRRPSVLLVGLGGGTQVHLLHQLARPRLMTVIERDSAIVDVALRWFGLDGRDRLEFLCGAAETVVPWLERVGRRFDFIMEDAVYAETPSRALPLARALVPLVAPAGVLVLNRHRQLDARRAAAALRSLFSDVRLQLVRREGNNTLVICRGAGAAVMPPPAAAYARGRRL